MIVRTKGLGTKEGQGEINSVSQEMTTQKVIIKRKIKTKIEENKVESP